MLFMLHLSISFDESCVCNFVCLLYFDYFESFSSVVEFIYTRELAKYSNSNGQECFIEKGSVVFG